MPWMSDERYMLMQDTKEKKSTARSARHTRTHCGKSGAVKLPSDFLTKKEIQSMNGECKSYKLNAPMTWKEFKAMPEDLQIDYIKLLRHKYRAPNLAIAKMLGTADSNLSLHLKPLGLGTGRSPKVGDRKWDKEGFYAWINEHRNDKNEEEVAEIQEEIKEVFEEEKREAVSPELIEKAVELTKPYFMNKSELEDTLNKPYTDGTESFTSTLSFSNCGHTDPPAVPKHGHMMFEGNIHDIVRTLETLLQNGNVRLNVEWEVVE